MEPAGQPETDQDQLAVHAKEGQEAVPVRITRPQRLKPDRRGEAPGPAHKQQRVGEVCLKTAAEKHKPFTKASPHKSVCSETDKLLRANLN